MRSSTRNQPNVETLRADKRIDELVKKQVAEHQHLIANHNSEMQAMRDSALLASQKYEALWRRSEQELQDLAMYTSDEMKILKERIAENEYVIVENKKSIQALHAQLQDFHAHYCNKGEAEILRKDLDSKVKTSSMSHLVSLQEMQRELKTLFKSLKDDFQEYRSKIEVKFTDLIDNIEENFKVTRIDRDGVLKEIRVYEKTIFIIEKKIENIYTLIERINKKDELRKG